MKKVYLLTGNERKKASFVKATKKYNISVDMKNLWLPEIQSNDNSEVASFAAQYAANKLNLPVIKMDSGFYIEALKGFPGPLVKYADQQIGADLFFNIIKNVKNKKAKIKNSLAYCEPNSEPVIFESGCNGIITSKLTDSDGSFIDRLFIPSHKNNSQNQTMGNIRRINYNNFLEIWGDAETQFAKWYINR